jgi:PAS domain S-box-containing protein
MKRHILRLVLPVLCALVCVLPFGGDAGAAPVRGNILYLNSYHDGYSWSDDIFEGLREGLQGHSEVELQVEYMDYKKYELGFLSSLLGDLYKRKFRGMHFDVIVLSDNNAFNFYLERGAELFPGVPAVFCGINDFSPEVISGRDMTGVVENFDVADTLGIALKFHPEKKRLVIIGDESVTGVAIRNQLLDATPRFKDRLDVEYWSGFDTDELRKQVREASDDTFFFFIPFYQSIKGRFYSAAELLEIASRNTSSPIYSSWEFLLGHGIVGGKLLSGQEHGRKAAELALRVLGGERAGDIPVVHSTPSRFEFDYNQLQKMGIDESELPVDSIIVNAPKAFYEVDRGLFWTIMVSFFLLMVTTLFLVRNIARRRMAEMEMEKQLSFQEILMDTIPMLVTWKGRKQIYLGANRYFADFFGLASPSKIIGRKESAIPVLNDYLQWDEPLDRQVMETERPIRRQRRTVINAKGQTCVLEVNKVPLLDEKGNVMGTLTTGEDVTKEANLEKQLLQSQKMEAIGTLAGGIAHDFNNILTSIINSTELAQLDVDTQTPAGQDLERVLKAAQRGSGLVKKILTFSRPSQEGFQYVKIEDVVRDAVGLLKASLPRNIKVTTQIGNEMGTCLADPTQIHQVVMNLCTNAFHALRPTGGRLEITLETEEIDVSTSELRNLPPGSYAVLTVADNGPGIPPEIVDKIFDPFFTTKGKAEGTGLGLAVVLGIIKVHKGSVEVTSAPGMRTAFVVRLPRVAKETGESAGSVVSATPGQGRILFVEDDPDQLATIPRVLEMLGYRVVPVHDAAAGLDRIAHDDTPFDLVITDYDMPGQNGVELARSLAEVSPDMPVLMVSGRERAVQAAQAMPNIVKVVLKPYDRNTLSEAIREILQTNAQ